MHSTAILRARFAATRCAPSARLALRRAAALAAILLSVSCAAAQLRIVSYNVLQLNGDLNALQAVFAGLNNDDKAGFAVAPHVYIFQEVQTSDVPVLLARLNAAAPSGVTYSQATFTSSGTEDGAGGAQALFYRGDTINEVPAGHVDIATGSSRNTDRWRLQLNGYSSPSATFYVYGSHLPAGNTSADATQRFNGVVAIRSNADIFLGAGAHIIYAGDMNVYTNTETAYQRFLAAGAGQALDPLGTANWTGSGNAIKHTQSTHLTASGPYVGGGMDDRFDMQLPSIAFHDGEGLALIPGLYRVLGNDGLHYNNSVNAGNNSYYPADIPRSNALAANIFNASDHLPVVVEYQVPAKLDANLPTSFGRVIQNALVSVDATVNNAASALVASGADELDYTLTSTGVVSGNFAGTRAALSAPAVHTLAINTASVGALAGLVTVSTSSQAAEPPQELLTIIGDVVRRSNASLSSSADLNTATLALNYTADTGVQTISASVFNRGFDSNQALLDVDSVTGLTAPFAFVSGLQAGIGAGSATLNFSFDTSGLSAGTYSQQASINCSDENLPGAGTELLTLTIDVQVASGCTLQADLDNDQTVGPGDLGILLGAWETSAAGDVDGDLQTGPADLGILLGAWGASCP